MSLNVTFQLSDRDLEHFMDRMSKVKPKFVDIGEAGIINAADKMLRVLQQQEPPDFIRMRIEKIDILLRMIRDETWQLAGDDRKRIIHALTYVLDPQDLIPDQIPGIGLLDDAIMIELVCRDLKHDIEAYLDFCAYRDAELKRRGVTGGTPTQETWLTAKRIQLHERMHRRRKSLWEARLGRSLWG